MTGSLDGGGPGGWHLALDCHCRTYRPHVINALIIAIPGIAMNCDSHYFHSGSFFTSKGIFFKNSLSLFLFFFLFSFPPDNDE